MTGNYNNNTKTYRKLTLKHKKSENFICVPTEHQGVHKNSFRNVCAFQIELEFGNVGF